VIISKVSFEVAWQLSSCRAYLVDFFTNATPSEIMHFTHYNFYYSYPSFGRIWLTGHKRNFIEFTPVAANADGSGPKLRRHWLSLFVYPGRSQGFSFMR
jgi:hypothetical protein